MPRGIAELPTDEEKGAALLALLVGASLRVVDVHRHLEEGRGLTTGGIFQEKDTGAWATACYQASVALFRGELSLPHPRCSLLRLYCVALLITQHSNIRGGTAFA